MSDEKIIGYMDLFISKLTKRQIQINDNYIYRNKIESLQAAINSLVHKKNFFEHKKSEGRITDEENSWLNFIPKEIQKLQEKLENYQSKIEIIKKEIEEKI